VRRVRHLHEHLVIRVLRNPDTTNFLPDLSLSACRCVPLRETHTDIGEKACSYNLQKEHSQSGICAKFELSAACTDGFVTCFAVCFCRTKYQAGLSGLPCMV